MQTTMLTVHNPRSDLRISLIPNKPETFLRGFFHLRTSKDVLVLYAGPLSIVSADQAERA